MSESGIGFCCSKGGGGEEEEEEEEGLDQTVSPYSFLFPSLLDRKRVRGVYRQQGKYRQP